jgi:hypothetical protein
VGLSQARQRVERAVAHRRRLLEAHGDRLRRDSRALRHGDELGVGTEAEPRYAEDLITDGELAYGGADLNDFAGELASEDPLPRPADSKDEAADELDEQAATPVGLARMTVQPVDGGRMDLDQDCVVPGCGPLDLFEL